MNLEVAASSGALHHVIEESCVFRFHRDPRELAGLAIEGGSLEKDHLGRMARTVDGDLMPDDHLVAGVEEGHGAAAGIGTALNATTNGPTSSSPRSVPASGEGP